MDTTPVKTSDLSDFGSDTLECCEKLEQSIDGVKLTPAGKLYVWDENTQPSCIEDIPPHATEAQRRYWTDIFNGKSNTVARIGTHKGRMASNTERSESPYIPEKIRSPIRNSTPLESENEDNSSSNERRIIYDTDSECEYRPTPISEPLRKNCKATQTPNRNSDNNGKHKQSKNTTTSNTMDNSMVTQRGTPSRTNAEKAADIIHDITTPRRSRRDMDPTGQNPAKRRLEYNVRRESSTKKRNIRTEFSNESRIETPINKKSHDYYESVPAIKPKSTKPNILSKRKHFSLQYESYTDGRHTNNEQQPSTSTDRCDGGPSIDTESDIEPDIPTNLYSFIWHPKEQETLDSLGHTHAYKKNTRGRRPDYTYFIHGNTVGYGHIHVIFTATSNSIARKRERICRDLPNCVSKDGEIVNTTITIKTDTGTNFANYCGRRGARTHYRVGKGVKEIDKFYENLDTEAEQIAQDSCTQFYQKKRNARKQIYTGNILIDPDNDPEEDSGTVYQKMYTVLQPYLDKYRPENLTEFHKKLPLDTQLECMKRWGTRFETFAKSIIQLHRTHDLQTKKNTPFWELALQYIKKDLQVTPLKRGDLIKAYGWLTTLFNLNGHDMIEFFGKFLLIQDMAIPKLNSFVLRGPTNTGKSMLLTLLLECVEPALIMRMGDASQFYLQNLVTASAVLFEEPTISSVSINTFKLLMAGEKCATDVKNQNTHTIYRLPNYYTTNIALGADCAFIHKEALKIRMFEFILNNTIHSEKIDGVIPTAPVQITSTILYLIILAHINDITDYQLKEFPNAKIKWIKSNFPDGLINERPFGHDLDWLRHYNLYKPSTSTDFLDEYIGSDTTFTHWTYNSN